MNKSVFRSLLSSVILISALFAGLLPSQTLRRKGMLGIKAVPVDAATAKETGYAEGSGMLVQEIIPGSTALAAGVLSGDLLTHVNGKATVTMDQFISTSVPLREGDPVTFQIIRGKKEKTLKAAAVAKPYEQPPLGTVIYDLFEWRGGYIRTIVRRPPGEGKHPVIFLIPGYNCASYDNMPPHHPYKKMIDWFVEKGYAVMRTEKPGMGDCEGTPKCADADFHLEQEVFEKGYEQLKKYDFIDQENIFVLGHSLGGIQAPVLASKYKPKGVIVYGTRHEPWSEYLTIMLRFQNTHVGVSYTDNEADMRIYKDLLYRHYVKKESAAALAAENPEYRRLLERDFQFDGNNQIFQRHEKFWQDLEDLNMTRYWSEVNSYVLSLYGEADFEVVNDWSHRTIADIVNTYHPGKGQYTFVPLTNHGMLKVGTMEEGVVIQQDPVKWKEALDHKFNFELLETMHQWMQDKTGKQL